MKRSASSKKTIKHVRLRLQTAVTVMTRQIIQDLLQIHTVMPNKSTLVMPNDIHHFLPKEARNLVLSDTGANHTTVPEQACQKCCQTATGNPPHLFQGRRTCESTWPERIDVPIGLGKKAMALLGRVWRRPFHPDGAIHKGTPRPLVYCLPVRVSRGAGQREVEKMRSDPSVSRNGGTP